ncbi:MAG: 4'-phosphopantetheinyl transferase [Oscillospiraceae bacterium]|nr:4'-phosphopantetheinyl transferase [Oscillospiraceae bacterium]
MTELWCLFWEEEMGAEEVRALSAILPPRRRERLERTRDAGQRCQVLLAYGLLALALKERHGCKALPEIALAEGGKPFFPGEPHIHFSISHSDGAVLAGLSDAAVGVDIQREHSVGPHVMARLGPGLSEAEFLRAWVRREALVKRSGVGLAGTLGEEPLLGKGERYRALDLAPGYFAGICWEGEELVLLHRRTLKDLL